jgi:hypothetical protein
MDLSILPGTDEDTREPVNLDIRYPFDNRLAVCRTLFKPQASQSLQGWILLTELVKQGGGRRQTSHLG